MRRTLVLGLGLALLGASPAFAAPVPKVVLTAEQEKEFNDLWDRAWRSYEARAQLYCRLVQQSDAAVEYLTRTVKPAALTEKEAKRLVAALDSKDEATWKRAYRDLRLRDVRLAVSFDEAWAETKTVEQKLRLGYLLSGFGDYEGEAKSFELRPPRKPGGPSQLAMTNKNPRYGNGVGDAHQTFEAWMASQKESRWGTDSRAVVAAAVLERIGTKVARDRLRELANDGHPRAWTTTEALTALDRLNAPRPDATPMADLWTLPWSKFPEVATVNQFLDRPKEAVKFFRENLRPVKLTAAGAKKMLAKLFSDEPDEVRAALQEFDLTDPRLVMTLEDAWKETKTAPHRIRLVAAMYVWAEQPTRVVRDDYDPGTKYPMGDYSYTKQDGRWSADLKWRDDVPVERRVISEMPMGGRWIGNTNQEIERDRWYRENTAIYILDAIGTDEAVAVIKDMAAGHPDAGPTKAAKAVLARRGR